MYSVLHKRFSKFFIITFGVLLFSILIPLAAFAQPENHTLEIMGDGVANPVTFTMEELENMEQYQHVYSTVNTYPTKKWYTARGVKLRELFDLAGIKKEEAQLIRFVSSDGYEVTLTAKELLKDRRYYFPGLKENHSYDGSIPGSVEGKVEVEPIVALLSVEGSNNPDHITDKDALHLIIGQRAITEQISTLFLKHVSKIEVLTTTPEKWDTPRVNIPDKTIVPEGTMLELFNKLGDADKIYYTIDGSTPTVDSSMINWIAKRWHSLRPEDLGIINSFFEIKEDVVIKAKTIGPGREDSEVVTFIFTVDHTGEVPDPTKIPGGPSSGIILDRYKLNLEVGGTFRLEATVIPYNAVNKQVTWGSSDTSVATVDSNGLVTVVGEGAAIITATTVDGNHKAHCVVNDPNQDEVEVTDSEVIDSIKEEGQKVPNETEIEQEHPIEKKEPLTDEPSSAIKKLQHLAKRKDIDDFVPDDIASNVSAELSSSQNGRVFEMSLNAEPIPLSVGQDKLHIYMLIIFLILFLSGAGKRYSEYTKEYKIK